jgi:hypothetical protein
MNAIIENTAKVLVSAVLATLATVLFGGMVAVSAGTNRAPDAIQQGQDLQAQLQVGASSTHGLPA